MRFFELKDKNNRVIYLTKERWLHISKEHPEVSNYFKSPGQKMKRGYSMILDSNYETASPVGFV